MVLIVAENIDEDLQASKNIVDDIQEKETRTENHAKAKDSKRSHSTGDDRFSDSKEPIYGSVLRDPEELRTANEKNWELKNITENQHKINNWPDPKQNEQLYASSRPNHKPDYFSEDIPQIKYQPVSINRNQHRQFEYRVVTDRPFVHSKTPKAYIAVSVIAPKPMEPQEDDFFLESELRQLKPWPLRPDYQDVEPRWVKKAKPGEEETDSP